MALRDRPQPPGELSAAPGVGTRGAGASAADDRGDRGAGRPGLARGPRRRSLGRPGCPPRRPTARRVDARDRRLPLRRTWRGASDLAGYRSRSGPPRSGGHASTPGHRLEQDRRLTMTPTKTIDDIHRLGDALERATERDLGARPRRLMRKAALAVAAVLVI